MSTSTAAVPRASVADCPLIPTRIERMLLRTASALQNRVHAHMRRRATPDAERVSGRAADRRRDAQALGALGILQR